MDIGQITRSVLETISENSVDGVIAPMFFAFLGSFIHIDGVSLALPFAMGYKAINTLDSMVGYKMISIWILEWYLQKQMM